MNRRTFLNRLGIGTVATIAVAAIPTTVTETIIGTLNPGWNFSVEQGPALSLTQLRNLKQQLVSRNVQSHMSGKFVGVVHPDVIKDLKFERVPEIQQNEHVFKYGPYHSDGERCFGNCDWQKKSHSFYSQRTPQEERAIERVRKVLLSQVIT